jgi:hypothetical protein
MARLEFFHLLTGVWQDGGIGATVWAQIRRQLESGSELNQSERAVLAALLKRMEERPEARKALGIRPRSRTAERNDQIAEYYEHQRNVEGKTAPAAASAVRKRFPKVGARAIRGVLESKEILAAARVRVIANITRTEKTPTK